MPETDSGECPAPNPISRPGRDRAMSYPLDNPRKEDPPVPVGPYYFETLNKVPRRPILLTGSRGKVEGEDSGPYPPEGSALRADC